MGMANHLFLRGTMWTWRRRWPGFSTKTRHLQRSLRTHDRVIARILASRLTYESNRMFDAITLGELSTTEAKAWLESVIRAELRRVERQRMIARLDPVHHSGICTMLEGSKEERQTRHRAMRRC